MQRMQGNKAVFLTLALLIALALYPPCLESGSHAWAAVADKRPLVLGVHPYLAPSELIRRFSPLAEAIGKNIGRVIRVEISRDYAEHIKRIGEGTVDMAYMGPASYVEAVRVYGSLPLLAIQEIRGKSYFRGVIIRRSGSKILDLKDLRGGKFAFGDPASTMSHLVPRYMLLEAGLGEGDFSFEFLRSHDNVAMGVLVGDFDAGAVKEEAFEQYRSRGLEILSYTPEIAEHVFIAGKGMPVGTVRSVRRAMHALGGQKGDRQALSSIKPGLSGLAPVEDNDYDNLRSIMDRLQKAGVRR